MNKLILLVIAVLLASNIAKAQSLSEVRSSFELTLKVVDETGKPVMRANMGLSWGLLGNPKPDTDSLRKESNELGIAVFSGETKFGRYAFGATKDGYYPSSGSRGQFASNKSGRWEPWAQEITVVLLPVKNPVAMHVKRIVAFVPENGRPCGYDLQKGDWVAPYGTGAHSDIEFLMEGRVESELNYEGKLTLQFPGAENGIRIFEQDSAIHSEFRLPYIAPGEGYVSSWSWRNARTTEKKPGALSTMVDESFLGGHFIFRVRSIVDTQGNVIRANYGKIRTPVQLTPRLNGKWAVDLLYYLNPDETRNLEFDPKRNLFKDQNVTTP